MKISYLFMLFNQALKFCTLVIKIYCYQNFDLMVVLAKIVQNFLETSKNENNLLKRGDFRKTFQVMYHGILTQTLSLCYSY